MYSTQLMHWYNHQNCELSKYIHNVAWMNYVILGHKTNPLELFLYQPSLHHYLLYAKLQFHQDHAQWQRSLKSFKVPFKPGIVPTLSGHIPSQALSVQSSPELSLFTFLQTWTKPNTTNSYSSTVQGDTLFQFRTTALHHSF